MHPDLRVRIPSTNSRADNQGVTGRLLEPGQVRNPLAPCCSKCSSWTRSVSVTRRLLQSWGQLRCAQHWGVLSCMLSPAALPRGPGGSHTLPVSHPSEIFRCLWATCPGRVILCLSGLGKGLAYKVRPGVLRWDPGPEDQGWTLTRARGQWRRERGRSPGRLAGAQEGH